MSDHRLSAPLLAVNALATAFVAALFVQVFHEVCHGITASLVGGHWEWLALFAVSITSSSQLGTGAELAIAGSPAILNIVAGAVAVALFELKWIRNRPGLRLFLLYVASFSLFAGFSYLLFGPIVYPPGENAGDWQQVVSLLRGDWMIRAAISLIGAAGVLRSLSWLAQSTLRFSGPFDEISDRIPLAFSVLMVPYVGVNLIFSILAFRHPNDSPSATSVLLEHWLGTMGFFWCFFLVAYWMRQVPSPPQLTPLPARALVSWCIAAVLGIAVAAFVLLPKIRFG